MLNNALDTVKTIGGICGSAGFLDGPLGVNMLSLPDMVGVDEEGNVFVMDSGNNYIRMINASDGYMSTLINGACFATNRFKPAGTVNIYESLCYKKWIKTSGEPSAHIYIEESSGGSADLCTEHITQCKGYAHPLHKKTQTQ